MTITGQLLRVLIAIVPLVGLLLWQFSPLSEQRISMQSSENVRASIPVIVAGIPAYSHLEKSLPSVEGLIKLGYPVTYITGEEFRELITNTSATFEPLDGPPGLFAPEEWKYAMTLPGPERATYLPVCAFVNRLPDQQETLQRILAKTQSTYGKSTPIVYLHIQSYLGLLPVQLGAEGIRPTVEIALGIAPLPFDSKDTYPFPALSPPDTSSNSVSVHQKAHKERHLKDPVGQALSAALTAKLKELGSTQPAPYAFHAMGAFSHHFLQLGLPEFEYPRSDLPIQVSYLGIPSHVGGSRELPSWWSDVATAKADGKKIIVVSQGSAWPDLNNLVIPTIKALANRDDFLVIATSVVQKPEDVPGLRDSDVPSNTRVSQFVPFDLLLPETTLLIAAGGYGTVLQAIAAGVPMVLAGTTQDKGHIGVLAAHTKIAVNLGTDTPSTTQIQDAVEEVLGTKGNVGNQAYQRKIREMKRAAEKYDSVAIMDRIILEEVKMRRV